MTLVTTERGEPKTGLDHPYRVEHAKLLQRKGYTFAEIARMLCVDRADVVLELYYRGVAQ